MTRTRGCITSAWKNNDAEETIAPLTEFLKVCNGENLGEKPWKRGERENRKKRLEEIR